MDVGVQQQPLCLSTKPCSMPSALHNASGFCHDEKQLHYALRLDSIVSLPKKLDLSGADGKNGDCADDLQRQYTAAASESLNRTVDELPPRDDASRLKLIAKRSFQTEAENEAEQAPFPKHVKYLSSGRSSVERGKT